MLVIYWFLLRLRIGYGKKSTSSNDSESESNMFGGILTSLLRTQEGCSKIRQLEKLSDGWVVFANNKERQGQSITVALSYF